MSSDRSTIAPDWLLSEPSRLLFALCDPAHPKLHLYLELLSHLFNAEHVALYSPFDKQTLAVSSTAKISGADAPTGLLQLAELAIAENDGCIVISDSENDARLAGQNGPGAMLALPVHFGDNGLQVLGAIAVALSRPTRFLASEIETLERIGRLLEVDIAALDDVNRDAGTRLNSRTGFTSACKHVLQLCQRIDYDATLVLFEIPELELVQRHFGEEFRNLIVRSLGALVYSTLRSSDVVGRLDDALFGALLPHNTNFDITSVFRRFQLAVENFNRSLEPTGKQPLAYSLSPAMSYLPVPREDRQSVEGLLSNRQRFIPLFSPGATTNSIA